MIRQINAVIDVLESRRLLADSLAWGFGWGIPDVYDCATNAVTDSAGNTFVTGVFRGKVDVNPSKSQTRFLNSKGSKDDIFVCKYNKFGQLSWAVRMGSVGIDTADAIALGPDGGVYVGGTFREQAQFGFGSNAINVKGRGGMDGYIVKLNRTTGAAIWAGAFGGQRDDKLNAIAVGSGGQLYLSGAIRLNGDIDPSGKTRNIVTRGTDDNFIERLNPANGSVVWSKVFGENKTIETVQKLSVAPDGGVVAAGFFNETLPLDRSNSKYNVTAVGWYDIYLTKIDSSGHFDWSTSFGGKKLDTLGDMTLSPAGDIYVTGNFIKTMTIGSDALGTDYETQAYIAKFSGTGHAVWGRCFGSEGNVTATSIAVGSNGDVYAAGYYDDDTNFNTAGGTNFVKVDKDDAGYLPEQESPTDAYVSRLTASGDYISTVHFGGINGSVEIKDMTADASGGLILVGQFANVININPFTNAKKILKTREDNDDGDVLIMKLQVQHYV